MFQLPTLSTAECQSGNRQNALVSTCDASRLKRRKNTRIESLYPARGLTRLHVQGTQGELAGRNTIIYVSQCCYPEAILLDRLDMI